MSNDPTPATRYLEALTTSFQRHAEHAASSLKAMQEGTYTASSWYEDQVLIGSRILQDTSACVNALFNRPPVKQ